MFLKGKYMDDSSKYIIKCKDLNKSFRSANLDLDVLKSINLQISYGEFVMLVGPSGCGKTTLISIIAGILSYDNGDCIVDNNNYKQMTEKEKIKFRGKNIGFVFQSYNLIPTITVAENIAIPLIISGMSISEAVKEAKNILEIVGLDDKDQLKPSMLSGGQQQRVAIARALIHKPKILICDEPTSALDFNTGNKIVELMYDINKKSSTTFIIVTHDNRILEYADRIIKLNDGEVVN